MTETGKRYGTSLYELAAEEGLTERILAELDVAVNAMQEPGYLRLLMTPSVPKKERCALLDQAFAQAHPYLVNFLKILCEAGILPELPACARAYRDRYNQDHNILEVTAVSAVALDESARSRITAAYMTCYFIGGAAGSALGTQAWTRYGWNGVCAVGIALALAALLAMPRASGRR